METSTETSTIRVYAIGAIVSVAALLICMYWLSVRMDPREPPLVRAKIPFIGHILGMLQYQVVYFDMLAYGHSSSSCDDRPGFC